MTLFRCFCITVLALPCLSTWACVMPDDAPSHTDRRRQPDADINDPRNFESTTTGDSTTTTTTSNETSNESDASCGQSCALLASTCPDDHHCVPYACGRGEAQLSAPICVPMGLRQRGESCAMPWDGDIAQHCAHNLFCWDGTCHDRCIGDATTPRCQQSNEVCLHDDEFHVAVCVLACDPLHSQCSVQTTCVPLDDEIPRFGCLGQNPHRVAPRHGEPCDFRNACAQGHACRPNPRDRSKRSTACRDSSGCCVAYCDRYDESSCETVNGDCEAMFSDEHETNTIGWCVD